MYEIKELQKLFIAVSGTFLFAIGMNCFIVPAGLYSGGFLGVGQVIRTLVMGIFKLQISHIDIAGIIYYVINVPLFLIAYRELGKNFFVTTIVCVTFQTIFLTVLPVDINLLNSDPFGSAVIGGGIAGAGVGITLRYGGSGGGQDILGVYLMRNNNKFSVGKVSMVINFFVYIACALLYDMRIVIYSLVYTIVSSYVIDKIYQPNLASS